MILWRELTTYRGAEMDGLVEADAADAAGRAAAAASADGAGVADLIDPLCDRADEKAQGLISRCRVGGESVSVGRSLRGRPYEIRGLC